MSEFSPAAKEVYEEERQKDPCRKFLMQNMCPFGDNCRYSHYHPHELERLRQEGKNDFVVLIFLQDPELTSFHATIFLIIAADLQTCLSSGSTTVQSMNEALAKMPSDEKIQNWLAVWEAKQKEESLKPAKPAVQAVTKAWCTDLPTELQGWRELPPSLQPWSRFNLQNVHLEDWG